MKILIVEDDKVLNETLSFNLSMEGFSVDSKYNFNSTIDYIENNDFDLGILDINLPDGDGFELSKRIKEKNEKNQYYFLTANDLEEDMVKGYKLGGIDYITKPFYIKVLIYKIKVILRKLEKKEENSDLYNDGFLKIDFQEQKSIIGGNQIEFTPKEYQALKLFIENPRIILTKRILLEKLWDIDGNFVDEHTLVTMISRLRKKIEIENRKYIKTTYGLGYQWIGGNKDET